MSVNHPQMHKIHVDLDHNLYATFLESNPLELILSTGTYSLDQMSDDEDMEGPGPRAQLGQPTSITTSQLAAALAAAAGGSGMQAAAQPQVDILPDVITCNWFPTLWCSCKLIKVYCGRKTYANH